jgi:dipeptidyl aminopeptidase/acylaminoacyl peptidase
MTVAAPPRPPSPARTSPESKPLDCEEIEALVEALFEEARRETRRRHRRYWVVAALAAFVGVGVLTLLDGGAASQITASAPGSPPKAQTPHPALRVRNGPLTVIDGDGILAVSSRGRRHQLFRCREYLGPRFCTIIGTVAWSPQGDTLLFSAATVSLPSSFGGMHLLDLATGKIRRAGREGFSPSWSRDGRIALVSPASWPRPVGSIQIRRIVGSHVTDEWLDTGTEGHDSSPSWSPDGKQLVFATRQDGPSTISIIGADGSRRRLLAEHASSPAWSPDGSVIAYESGCGVKLITPSGRDVTPGRHSGCHSFGFRGAPVWSPDGRRIAIPTHIKEFMGGNGIYVFRRDGRFDRVAAATSSSPVAVRAPVAWQPVRRVPLWHPKTPLGSRETGLGMVRTFPPSWRAAP